MEQLENRIKSEDWQGSIGDILGKMAGPLKVLAKLFAWLIQLYEKTY